MSVFYSDTPIMGIDLATWWARIGLNYYHMSDTPLVFKGCMTVVALSLILRYVVRSWSKLKGWGGGGKVHCHWRGSTSQVRGKVDGGETLLLRASEQ